MARCTPQPTKQEKLGIKAKLSLYYMTKCLISALQTYIF